MERLKKRELLKNDSGGASAYTRSDKIINHQNIGSPVRQLKIKQTPSKMRSQIDVNTKII
jgi:hypothetical protein